MALLLQLACASAPVVSAVETAAPTAEAAPAVVVMPTEEPTPPPAPPPTLAPTDTPAPPPVPFSIAWISDTQMMVYKRSLREALPPMFQWVADTKEEHNTICAVHTGDIVENGNNPAYWDVISPYMDKMAETVPVLAAAGNHDIARGKRDYGPFLSQPFMLREDPERQYLGGRAYYQIFDEGGVKILVAALGYDCLDEAALAWLRETFDAHPDCVGVIAVHSYLSYASDNTADYTREGWILRDNVVAKCKNVRLVLCGHVLGQFRLQEHYDDDGDGVKERTVNALRYNFQGVKVNNRSGYLRMLTFDPAARSIEVWTYSPYLDSDTFNQKKKDEEHFTLTEAF